MNNIDIKGAAELKRALGELPAKIEKGISRGALRAGAVVLQEEAQSLAPSGDSGRLRESISVSTGAKRSGTVYAHVRAGGRKKGDAFYAHMVEFGTKPHEIKPRKFKSLFLAGIFRKIVKHPGAKPKPFLRPAFDNKSGEAVDAIAAYIRARLARLAKAK